MLYNCTTFIDESLREQANSVDEMSLAVKQLIEDLTDKSAAEQISMLGHLVHYLRVLQRLDEAESYAHDSLKLCQAEKMKRPEIAARLRLATIWQWQGDYVNADKMFVEVIDNCTQSKELVSYLDFAHQHYAKSLFEQKQYTKALEHFEAAKRIRLQKNDQALIQSTEYAIEVCKKMLGIMP